MERSLSEFVAAVRRTGVRVSTAEAIDGLRALTCLGVSERPDLRAGLASVLGKSASERARVVEVFDAFFAAEGALHQDLFARLRAAGFAAEEVETLRQILEANARAHAAGPVYRAIAQGPLGLEQLLAEGSRRLGIERVDDPARVGFLSMRLLEALRVPRAETELPLLRSALRDALGQARGNALGDVLEAELSGLRERARDHVGLQIAQRAQPSSLEHVPFAALEPHEVARVERAVQELAERLIGRTQVRARHARRGRIDLPRTLRGALRTGGVPFVPRFRHRRPHRPKLVMMCDVSESVRASARFMLLFVHAVQRLFADAHSLVFVSDLADATQVFRRERAARAIELAYRGAIVSVADNSHYARVWRNMLADHARLLDPRTLLLILGDGRTNHFDPGEAAFRELSARVERVLWFSPEPESAWSSADSALALYAAHVDQVLPMHDLASLRVAARTLARF